MGKRGEKLCACGASNGPRSRVCKACGRGFKIRGIQYPDAIPGSPAKPCASTGVSTLDPRQKVKHKEVDWKTLVRNDIVKVVSGGPYWPAKDAESQPTPLGYHGIFKVNHIDHEGIHAYPVKAKNEAGKCYIYMSEEKKMASGTIMRPHKIVKVHKKVKND